MTSQESDNQLIILEGHDQFGDGEYLIQKNWGTDYDGDKYCNIEFCWDDEWEHEHGDMDTLLRGMFHKADDNQKQILRIIMNEFRRHIMIHQEFLPMFDTKQNSDNYITFILKLKKYDKQPFYNTIKRNGTIIIRKVIIDEKRTKKVDGRTKYKFLTFSREIDC